MFILVIFLVILFLVVVWFLIARKYRNPYKFTLYFGKPGAGKSTLLMKTALQYQKRKWTVYSTEPLSGCYTVDPQQIGLVHFEPNSVLLIDEIGTIFDNRHFKDFKDYQRDFFKLHRHYKVAIVACSQVFNDIDLKCRNVVDNLYLLRNVGNIFSYAKKINKRFVLTKSVSDRPSTIAEDYFFESFFWFWLGSRHLTFIPRYAKYFDSFKAPKLREVNFTYEEFPAKLRKYSGSRRGIRRSRRRQIKGFFKKVLGLVHLSSHSKRYNHTVASESDTVDSGGFLI